MIPDLTILPLKSEIRAQIERCNDLLDAYAEIGPNGFFGHAAISDTIENAVASMVSDDPIQMREWLEKLKGCK